MLDVIGDKNADKKHPTLFENARNEITNSNKRNAKENN